MGVFIVVLLLCRARTMNIEQVSLMYMALLVNAIKLTQNKA